jgi:hypothetical protein
MKIITLLSFALLFCLFSCAKQEDEPSTPVINLAKAINSYDSIGIINCLNSLARDHYYARPDSTRGMEYFKKVKVDIKVLRVEKDFSNPENQANVVVLENMVNHDKTIKDTFCYRVFREKDGWKLTDMALE